MSIQTTVLKYGWSIVAGVVLTGATIFTSDSTLKYITQRDAIQVILGTVERCLATQTGTNTDGTAIYAVAPPSYVRTWTTTNGLTGTNFAWVTNQVTNSISWYTDRAMMVDLDAKIFALIPYYVNTNTVYGGTTNISMLTVTDLFASLQIGDHTNQFTAIPCWTNNAGTTNATTNAATFGPWANRMYVKAFEERYKVLNALKVTKAARTRSYKGTDQNQTSFSRGIFDPNWHNFSNNVTGEMSPDQVYMGDYLVAHILGLENGYYYSDQYWTNSPNPWGFPPSGAYLSGYKNLTYQEYQTCHNWWFFHQMYLYSTAAGGYHVAVAPWTPYPDGYIDATNVNDCGAGSWFAVTKRPLTGGYTPLATLQWLWEEWCRVTYSTWEFTLIFPGQQVTNTCEIYLKPTLPGSDLPTEIKTAEEGQEFWSYPRAWEATPYTEFEEFSGMSTGIYSKLDTTFIQVSNGVGTVVFGSDQFPPLRDTSMHPSYPDAPSEGVHWYDNAGSIGTSKGMYLGADDYCFMKTWQFNYATNKYW